MFKVGQKVVCISDGRWIDDNWDMKEGPTNGEVLTIDFICHEKSETFLGFYKYGTDQDWSSECFRPLEENTDWVEEVLENALVEELELVE